MSLLYKVSDRDDMILVSSFDQLDTLLASLGAMAGPNNNALAAEVRLLATCPGLQRLHGGTLQEAVLGGSLLRGFY